MIVVGVDVHKQSLTAVAVDEVGRSVAEVTVGSLAGAVATMASSAVFLDVGVSSNYMVIIASRLLAGLGFGLAYPALNIQALSGAATKNRGSRQDSSAAPSRSAAESSSQSRRRCFSHTPRPTLRRRRQCTVSRSRFT